jgi:DNA polymerase III epsilon subunit-like protein
MLILGVDFESTWQEEVDATSCHIIEIGAVLYDTDRKSPVKIISELTWDYEREAKPLIEEGTTKLTGITTQDMYYSKPIFGELSNISTYMQKADYICAHNGTFFDKVLFEAECTRHSVSTPIKPWIDTCIDVPYPDDISTRKLTYLAAEHGIVNLFSHRALFDVLVMLKVLDCYDINKVIESAEQKLFTITANVSFAKKDLAKRRGYYWNPTQKIWYKNLKEKEARIESSRAPFPVTLKEI